jgi:uncharacterized caspase-like protein
VYRWGDRRHHVRARRAVAPALRRIGFTAAAVPKNPSCEKFSRALPEFAGAIEAGDTVLFFFAGHGFEIRPSASIIG